MNLEQYEKFRLLLESLPMPAESRAAIVQFLTGPRKPRGRPRLAPAPFHGPVLDKPYVLSQDRFIALHPAGGLVYGTGREEALINWAAQRAVKYPEESKGLTLWRWGYDSQKRPAWIPVDGRGIDSTYADNSVI